MFIIHSIIQQEFLGMYAARCSFLIYAMSLFFI